MPLVYVPVIANVTCVVVQVTTVNVELTLLGVLVVVGLNPASVIVEPTKNGWTGWVAYVIVPVPPPIANAVAVIATVVPALVCDVLAMYTMPPYLTNEPLA